MVEPIGERFPLDVLHRDERPAVFRLPDLVDLAYIRMVERRRGLRLPAELSERIRIVVQFRRQEFQRYPALELRVLGEEHLSHPALADGLDDAVAHGAASWHPQSGV